MLCLHLQRAIPAWYFMRTFLVAFCLQRRWCRQHVQCVGPLLYSNCHQTDDLPHTVCDQGTAGRLRAVPRLFWGLAKHRWQLTPADTTHISRLATEFTHESEQEVSFSRGFLSLYHKTRSFKLVPPYEIAATYIKTEPLIQTFMAFIAVKYTWGEK